MREAVAPYQQADRLLRDNPLIETEMAQTMVETGDRRYGKEALTCASRGGGRLFAAFAFLCLAHADASADPWAEVMTPLPGPAEIFGGPTHGCIVGARPLPPDGPGYEVVRLSRRRYFGHPDLVAFIKRLGRRARAAGLPPFYVGDMAQPRGGPMPAGHAAHRSAWRPTSSSPSTAIPTCRLRRAMKCHCPRCCSPTTIS